MSQYIKKIRTQQGDLQIDYEALANLPNLPSMISNPNLLINSDFRNPVNQRGQTKYAPSKNILHYTIDRWGTFPSVNDGEGHSVTVNNGYITFANTNANMSAYFIQHLEVPLTGTYTLSVKVKSATKAFSLSYRDNGTVYRAMTLNTGMNSATINCTALNFIRFDISGAASVDIEWVKLEVGNIATAFSPRLFAEEVLLCKRFYQAVSSHRFQMMMTTGTAASGSIQLVPSMRTAPTVSIAGFKYFDYTLSGHMDANHFGTDTSYTTNNAVVIQIEKNSESTLAKGSALNGTIHAQFDAEIY